MQTTSTLHPVMAAALAPWAPASSEVHEIAKRCVEFDVEGKRYSLEQMLKSNADDPDFCEWARSAKAGDFFAGIIRCECLAPGDLSEADLLAIDLSVNRAKSDPLWPLSDQQARQMQADLNSHDECLRRFG